MKKSVRKADVVIILCLVLIFGVIIFMNTRLINNMMLDKTEQSSQNRLEIIRSEYENVSMEVEKALLNIVAGAERTYYSTKSPEAMEAYITSVHNAMKEQTAGVIMRIYIAGADWIMVPDAEVPKGYNVTEQEWYQGALEHPGELYFAEPYFDTLTGVRCFTLSMSLDDGATVISMDMKLDGVEEYVKRMAGDENSPAVIVTDTGLIVGYNDMNYVGKQFSEALPEYAAVLDRIFQSSDKNSYFEVSIGGESVTVFHSTMRNGWYMALFLDDDTLYGEANRQRVLNIIVNVMLMLLIITSFVIGARNRIKAQDALQSREEFVGQILNNLHEPLGKILRLSDMKRFNNSNDIKADMADIKASGLELKEMMDNLRSYSTIVTDMGQDAAAKKKKRRELAQSIRRFRNVIIILLILISGISMFFYVRNRNSAVQESVRSDLDIYNSELLSWEMEQSTILQMFTDIISSQSEILKDYDSAVEWLAQMTKNYDSFSVCYVANSEAEHRIIMNNGWEGDDFDPSIRDWYREAILQYPNQYVSEPYLEVTAGKYCITFSQAMFDKNGDFLGVFGIDFYLDKLVGLFEKEIYDDEYVFLVDSYGNILNHPNPEYRMTEEHQVKVSDTPYAGIYVAGGQESRIKTITDYNGKYSLCICKSDPSTGFSLIMVGNWWMMYRTILLYCAIYIIFIISCIVTVIILLNRVIRSQAEMNRELTVTADRAMAAGQAKSDFLAQMSHEIRTPINAVIGMDEMILRENKDPEIREYAENIKSASQTLLTLINGILDFSKIESGKMEIIRVRYETLDMVDSLVNMISERAEKKGLNLILDIDPTLPRTMFGDDVRIRQVITNLLTNAVKYTPKGDVTLSIRGEKEEGDDYTLKVAVKDTGIGIKKEDIEKLFQSFQRLDEERNRNIEGTGLGMSIVQGLLAMMDSKLEVESDYGQGSTFSFSLNQKVLDEEAIGEYRFIREKEEKAQEAERNVLLTGARILVVDDNEMNLRVARGLLKHYDVVPDLCDSGRKSLDMVKEKSYDIILMDHMMPGMDGVEVLHEIRKENLVPEEIPIIALTANAIAGARDEYLAYGFKDYLSKPIDVKQLEDMLIKYLPEDRVHYVDAEETAQSESTKSETKDVFAEQTKEGEAAVPTGDDGAEVQDAAASEGGTFTDRLAAAGFNIEGAHGFTMDDDEFYLELLETYVNGASEKEETIRSCYEAKDWKNYQVAVHGLKSSSRTIGADTLADLAYEQELAAKDEKTDVIENGVDTLLKTLHEVAEAITSAIR